MNKRIEKIVAHLDEVNALNQRYFALCLQADDKRRQTRNMIAIDPCRAIKLADDAEALHSEALIHFNRAAQLRKENAHLFEPVKKHSWFIALLKGFTLA